MGSSFLQKLNPASVLDLPGRLAGNNSGLARLTSYDPLMQTKVGQVLAPNMYARGQTYSQNTSVLPNRYAQAPSTYNQQRDANAGYVTAANNAVNQANKTWQQGSTNSPYGQ